MNRREAIAALTSLPGLASVSVASLQPGDVIVAECDGRMSPKHMEHVRAKLSSVWPNQKVVICDEGLRLKVVRPA